MVQESAAAVANNPDAPPAERYDATVAVHNQGLVDLLPSPQVQDAIRQIQEAFVDGELSKAARGNLIHGPWTTKRDKRAGQSVFVNEFEVTAQGEFWDPPGVLGFEAMRAMVQQTPILNSIVMTRIRQVNRFCRPVTDKSPVGFVIGHVDPTAEMDDQQQNAIKLLTRFVTNCGWETDPRKRKRLKRDGFSQFMAKSVRDSLTFDACPIETVFKRDRSLGIDGFHAIDGASIRLCTEQGYEGDDEVFAIQLVEGQVRTAYTYDDLVYEVRNPRTDLTACGYGYAEPEMLIRIVTYILNSMTYNGAFFDKNSIPRGMLNLVGNYDQADLASFKRYWSAMLRGAQNAHNMPVLVAKDGESKSEFVEIGGQMSEMAFAKWLSFLTAIACAIYGTVPEEISMESFAAEKSSLSGSSTGEQLVSSNDKGLRPLLGFYENLFSDYVLQPFSPDFCLRFKGLDDEAGQTRFEREKLALTWNELRSGIGMDPVDGKVGDAPINPALLSVWSQETGVGQPPEQEEDFGDPEAQGGAGFSGQTGDGGDEGDQGDGADQGGGDDAAGGGVGGKADFGRPPAPEGGGAPDEDDSRDAMNKALTAGLPLIYRIEG